MVGTDVLTCSCKDVLYPRAATSKAVPAGCLRLGVASYLRNGDGYNRLLDADGALLSKRASPQTQTSVRAKFEIDLADDLTVTAGLNYGLSSDPRGNLYKYVAYASTALDLDLPRKSGEFP